MPVGESAEAVLKRILIGGIGVLAVGVGAFFGVSRFSGGTSESLRIPGVLREVQQLSELVSVKFSIQKVVGLKEEKVPLGSESILLVVQGTVLAGVDLKELEERNVRVEEKSVFLRLPQARILHVYLDEKQTRVWDRKVTWWTPWVPYNPDFERKARLRAIESIREQAEEMGILRDARRNAEQTIEHLMKLLGADQVTFAPT